jgi:hypothetical protein
VLLLHGADVREELDGKARVGIPYGRWVGREREAKRGGVRLRLGGCEVFGPEWLRFQAGQGEVASRG